MDEEQENLDKEFEAAFDEELSAPSDKEKDDDAELKAAEEAKKAEELKAAEEAKKAEEAAKKAEPEEKDSAEILALKAQLDEIKAGIKPKEEEPVKGPTPAEIEAQKAEQEAWDKFEKDWPDQAGIANKLKAQVAALEKKLEDATKALQDKLDPVVESVSEADNQAFLKPILEKHPDALDLYNKGDVAKWIEKQPRRLQAGYVWALNNGKSEDVIEVFDDYKKANGVGTTEAEKKAAEAAAKAEEEKKAAELKKMEMPGVVRTSVTSEEDPDDFDAAFESEVKSGKYKNSGF